MPHPTGPSAVDVLDARAPRRVPGALLVPGAAIVLSAGAGLSAGLFRAGGSLNLTAGLRVGV
ncbi:hypothetical protein OG535_38125 [Kitasatospora sp. NBC_00085]|uniref:hypothetical protein n=1 Tax=unclassified Kitasatospora TaxID=2633591 RepID=UPI00324F609D